MSVIVYVCQRVRVSTKTDPNTTSSLLPSPLGVSRPFYSSALNVAQFPFMHLDFADFATVYQRGSIASYASAGIAMIGMSVCWFFLH